MERTFIDLGFVDKAARWSDRALHKFHYLAKSKLLRLRNQYIAASIAPAGFGKAGLHELASIFSRNRGGTA